MQEKCRALTLLKTKNTWDAFKRTGKNKVVLSGLWTSMCFAFTAIHAIKEEYEVYGLMDAAGDSTVDAHKYGVKRMLQVGVVRLLLRLWFQSGCMTGIIPRLAS